jgi:hypothetical protein
MGVKLCFFDIKGTTYTEDGSIGERGAKENIYTGEG